MNATCKILFTAIGVISKYAAEGQGVVSFQNRVLPSPPDRLVRDVYGTPLLGSNFVAQLLYQDRMGTWQSDPTIARFFTSSANAGFWNGGERTLVNAGSPIPTFTEPVNMQVRVWDAGFGGTTEVPPLTFDEAVAAGMQWGTSTVFVYTEEWDLPRGTDDTWMKNFRTFSLVPEPSTWALVALGAGWLFWGYRRLR